MKQKTKKHVKTTMAAAMAVGSIVAIAPMATQASPKFTDVKANDYYYEDVLQLAERGVVNGFSDGTFKPKQDVTRGQAAKIIAGVLGLDTTNVSNPGFKDVPTSNQYYGAIAALANAGIINGFEDGTFRPGNAVQRNHMAKIIAGAFNLQGPADFKTPLKDVRVDYAQYVTALYSAGVTTGKTATTFDGSSNVTRGQLASFLVRAENASAVVAKDVTFTISKVDGDKVNGYAISASLKGLLSEANNAALQGAVVNAKVSGDEIVGINSVQLNAAGTEGALVILDGGNSTIAGDLVVNADYVEVKNVTVQGNVTLTNNVKSEFTADGLINEGEFIVDDANSPVASLTPIFANTTNGPKIGFKNSNVKNVHVKRDNVSIASNVKLPELTVSAKVSTILVDADVAKFKVDVTVNIAITGAGSFDEVALEKAIEVALNIVGNITKLVVSNADAKVEVAASIKIGEVTLPANTTAAGIIKNYESIKGNINNVVSDNLTTPPVSGGSGGSGSGSSGGGSGSGGSNSGVDTTVTVTGVSANVGSDGKTISVSATVANSKATKATIEFYEVVNNVVAGTPLSNYTRQADIKDGKIDFKIAELPVGTYQVKVTVEGKSNVSTSFVIVSPVIETPGVDKTALTAAIAAVEYVAVSTTEDAANISVNDKWTTQEEKAALDAAVSAAQAVVARADATQTEVNATVDELAEAVATYEAAKKPGTKVETPGVDKTALTAAIAAVEYVAVSTTEDASNISVNDKWTTQEEKAALEAAVSAAQAVVAKADATQTEVNATVDELAEAVATYEAAKKPGTKVETLEPTTYDITFTSNEAINANNVVVTYGGATTTATIISTADTVKISFDTNVVADLKTAGSFTFEIKNGDENTTPVKYKATYNGIWSLEKVIETPQ